MSDDTMYNQLDSDLYRAKLTTPNRYQQQIEAEQFAGIEHMPTEAERTAVHKPFPASAASVWMRLIDSWQTFGRTLPTDSAFRKEFPIESGVNRYFPAAIVCCAAWSKFNNNKHNPGEPLHHSRAKSGDHEECIGRHNFDIADAERRNDPVTELEEATAVFWRAGARLQILCERLGAPLAPAARLPGDGGAL